MTFLLGRAMALWCVTKLRTRRIVVVLTALVVMVPGMLLRQQVVNIFSDHNHYANRLMRKFILSDDNAYFGFPDESDEKIRVDVHRSRRNQEDKDILRNYEAGRGKDSEFEKEEITSTSLEVFNTKQPEESGVGITNLDSNKKLDTLNNILSKQADKAKTESNKSPRKRVLSPKELDSLDFTEREQAKQYGNNLIDIDNKSNKEIVDGLNDIGYAHFVADGDFVDYNEWLKVKEKFLHSHRIKSKLLKKNSDTLSHLGYKGPEKNSDRLKNKFGHQQFKNEIEKPKIERETENATDNLVSIKMSSKDDNLVTSESNESSRYFTFVSPKLSNKNISDEANSGELEIPNHSSYLNISQHRGVLDSPKEVDNKALIMKKDPDVLPKDLHDDVDAITPINHHIESNSRGNSHLADSGSSAHQGDAKFDEHPAHRIGCRDVLKRAVVGKWVPRQFSQAEFDAVQNFINKTRDGMGLPRSLQRSDKKCGNVSFGEYKFGDKITFRWFRALCNPEGKSPCCEDNRCVSRTIAQCTCDGCLDMRQQIHAELSTWVPSDTKCELKRYNPGKKTCIALERFTVHFIGDSLLRQIFVAMLRLLKVPETETKARDEMYQCKGYFRYLPYCSRHLPFAVKTCGNKVVVKRSFLKRSYDTPEIIRTMQQYVVQRNSLVVLGMGMHDHLNNKLILETVVKPILSAASVFNSSWPKLVWVAPHAPGLLKSPWLPSQLAPSVLNFNKHINAAFTLAGIPVLDTFGITKDGVMTYDGLHFGEGVNTLKAHILMNYIQEIRTNDKTEKT